MIRWLESLLTPCPLHLRRMGYLREMLAIRACREQVGYGWQCHLERTQAILRQSLQRCTNRRTAVVFGSGWLHDVPLEELASAFRQVHLVDVLHPRATRRLVQRFPNVKLISADVTGTVEAVYVAGRRPGIALPQSDPQLYCDRDDVDWVASVNILCQLPYLPVEYLRKQKQHEESAIETYARQVIEAHLAYLQRLPGVAAFVGDVESQLVDRSGRVLDSVSTIHGVEIPRCDEEWTWKLAPVLYLKRDRGEHRRVFGIVNLKDRLQGLKR